MSILVMKKWPLLLLPFLMIQCFLFHGKKDTPQPNNPTSKLPPATREGRNTFGCVLNGKAWTPKGMIGLTDNFLFQYAAFYAYGLFVISTYRAERDEQNNWIKQYLTLTTDSLPGLGTYTLSQPGKQSFGFTTEVCEYGYNGLGTSTGTLTITKYTPTVISGTFEITLSRPGCDTIRGTEGCFDLKR